MPTGTIGVTLPKAAPAATGMVSIFGTVAVTLPLVSPASAGWSTISGTAAPVLPKIAPAITSGSGPAGTVAATLKAVSASAAGWSSLSGTVASTLKALIASGTGKTGIQGTASPVLAKIASALTGYMTAESNVIIGEPEIGLAINFRSSTTYTIDHTDRERLVAFGSSSAVAVTLPQAIGAFGDGFRFRAFNIGLGLVTVTATTSTINGLAAAVTIPQWDNIEFYSDGVNWYAVKSSPAQRTISINIDGGASTPATGIRARWSAPVACTVTGWVLTADASGSAVIDVLRGTYSAFPTTASIAGTDKPTLSTQQKNENLGPLSSWGSTAIAAGDVLEFNLDSVTTCKVLTLTLNITTT